MCIIENNLTLLRTASMSWEQSCQVCHSYRELLILKIQAGVLEKSSSSIAMLSIAILTLLALIFPSLNCEEIVPLGRLLYDDCGFDRFLVVQSYCLAGGRIQLLSNDFGQCRSVCIGHVPINITASRVVIGCRLCRRQAFLKRKLYLTYEALCIPRHVCIERCGPELPGCVYTGSCFSQICFKSAVDNTTATITRFTHHGPGTQLVVKSSESFINVAAPNTRWLSSRYDYSDDVCDGAENGYRVDTSGECSAIGDGEEADHYQCRVVCGTFDMSSLEVIRLPTYCSFCNRTEASQWIHENSRGKKRICIPRQTCIEQCGLEGYGCVYTGSCESRICFSSVNSKKAALFTFRNDTGSASSILVDHAGVLVDKDPPVFADPEIRGSATETAPDFNVNTAIGGDIFPNPGLLLGITTWAWSALLVVTVLTCLMIMGLSIRFQVGRKRKKLPEEISDQNTDRA